MGVRDWDEIVKRNRVFWSCSETDRPLIGLTYRYYVDIELVASVMGEGELQPDSINPDPILPEYDKIARAREEIGDDTIAVAEPLLGIPWLEAICGCPVMVPDGKSLWPEQPVDKKRTTEITFSSDNPWFKKLLEIIRIVADHAAGRYSIGLSHMRGPTDILIALLGAESFFMGLMDEPDRIKGLARQAAEVWLEVIKAQIKIVPSYRGGYGIRQFGLWSPERAAWLQDDSSSMMSLDQYSLFFLEPMRAMSVYPYGVLHLHIPSLHLSETLAQVPNIRAINLYFDSQTATLQDAMPTMRRLQELKMPLILAKDVYNGFTMDEYDEIMDGLSPKGLSVHLKAETLEEGQDAMAHVRNKR